MFNRWLVSVGKLKEAEEIVRQGATFNKISLPQDFQLTTGNNNKPTEARHTVLDLMRSPNMRAKTIILYYNWFVNTFSYYGLSLNMGSLTGGSSIYFNFSLMSLMEVPAYIAAMLLVLYYGRRVPYAMSLIIYGSSLVVIMLVPVDTFSNDWPITVLSLVSKLAITFSFGVVFLYTAELFPTELRTTGLGSANFVGKNS